MDWPARSPDLNPIEHVWDFLGRCLAARTLPPNILKNNLTSRARLSRLTLFGTLKTGPPHVLFRRVYPNVGERDSSKPLSPLPRNIRHNSSFL
ncbi:hypothetical protein TNCV_165061 [Trichonephila clavipes]|nr:hypothetical protein TNCV_165061 [Trichonephila clavipes]